MKVLPLFGILFALLITSCTPSSKPINYGTDACDYCRMTIVDERYGDQLVSTTGKVFNFDAIECQVNFRKENTETQWALELVTDYTNPKILVPTDQLVIIHSKQMPSPMGMYLTAMPKDAPELKDAEGKVYTFPELMEGFDELPQL